MASWRQNPMTAVVATVVLVIAVVLAVIAMQGPKVAYSLKCESCGIEFQTKLPKAQVFPIACPSCAKKTAYKAIQMKCKACGKTFAQIQKTFTSGTNSKDMARMQTDSIFKCPYCGAQGKLEMVE